MVWLVASLKTADDKNMFQLSIPFIWGVPPIRNTFLGVPIIRIIVFAGLYWGPLFWETPI